MTKARECLIACACFAPARRDHYVQILAHPLRRRPGKCPGDLPALEGGAGRPEPDRDDVLGAVLRRVPGIGCAGVCDRDLPDPRAHRGWELPHSASAGAVRDAGGVFLSPGPVLLRLST